MARVLLRDKSVSPIFAFGYETVSTLVRLYCNHAGQYSLHRGETKWLQRREAVKPQRKKVRAHASARLRPARARGRRVHALASGRRQSAAQRRRKAPASAASSAPASNGKAGHAPAFLFSSVFSVSIARLRARQSFRSNRDIRSPPSAPPSRTRSSPRDNSSDSPR
jgi:hypothetical protein